MSDKFHPIVANRLNDDPDALLLIDKLREAHRLAAEAERANMDAATWLMAQLDAALIHVSASIKAIHQIGVNDCPTQMESIENAYAVLVAFYEVDQE